MFCVFLSFARCESIIVNKIGSSFIDLMKGDSLHVDIPKDYEAFMYFSTKISSIKINGNIIPISDDNRALKTISSSVDLTVKTGRLNSLIWIIKKDICTDTAIWVSGNQYKLVATNFTNSGSVCVFPISTSKASIIACRYSGGSLVGYRGIDDGRECNKTTCTFATETPLFIQLKDKVNVFSLEYISVNELIFDNLDKGFFTTLYDNGKSYFEPCATLRNEKYLNFIKLLKEKNSGMQTKLGITLVFITLWTIFITAISYCTFTHTTLIEFLKKMFCCFAKDTATEEVTNSGCPENIIQHSNPEKVEDDIEVAIPHVIPLDDINKYPPAQPNI